MTSGRKLKKNVSKKKKIVRRTCNTSMRNLNKNFYINKKMKKSLKKQKTCTGNA